MREKAAPSYWAAGALAGIGLMTVGGPFLLAGAVLALVGLLLLRTKGIWAFFVGFGGWPALVFLLHISNGVITTLHPYCAQPGGPDAAAGAGALGPVSVSCSSVPASYYAVYVRGVCGGRAFRGGPGSLAAAHRPSRRFIILEGSPRASRRRTPRSSCGGLSGTF
jgi:hypothetical protein